MLIRFDMRITLQLPDARIGVGRSEDPGLFVRDYAVFCRVDDEERYTLFRELRGIHLRYHVPGVEIGEEPPCEQDRRPKGPPEAYEVRNLALQKDWEIRAGLSLLPWTSREARSGPACNLAAVTRRAHRVRRELPCSRGYGAYRPIRPVPVDPARAHCSRRHGRREGSAAGTRRTCIRPNQERAPLPGTNPPQAPTMRSDGRHRYSGTRPPCIRDPQTQASPPGICGSGRSSTEPLAIPRRSTPPTG